VRRQKTQQVTSQIKYRLGQLEKAVKINYSNCWNPLELLELQSNL